MDVLRTQTTTQLLEALMDPAEQAVWTEFDERFRPILFGLARRMGLGADEAAEIAQQTLVEFVRDYREGKYQRTKGRLCHWILGIARHRILDVHRVRAKQRNWRGDSVLDQLPQERELESIWEDERERTIFARAWQHLQDHTDTAGSTLRVFELTALEGIAPPSVARACDISVDEVYRIKHRLTKRLKGIVAELTRLFEEEPARA